MPRPSPKMTLSAQMAMLERMGLRDPNVDSEALTGYLLSGAGEEPGMRARPQQSRLGEFLGEEHGPLGMRLGDFTPASYALAMKDFRELGVEAEAAEREGSSTQAYALRALQGTAGLGAVPFLGAAIRPVYQGAKRVSRKVAEAIPDIGGRFGPREGFYSLAERVTKDKVKQAMTPAQFIQVLRGNQVKEAEIRALDLERLAREHPGSMLPEDLADWVRNRRTPYTEKVLANMPSASDTDLPYDRDALRRQAAEEHSNDAWEQANEQASNDYSVEAVEFDEDDEPIAWAVVDENGERQDVSYYTRDTGDDDTIALSETGAERARERIAEARAQSYYDNAIGEFDADDYIESTYGSMEEMARDIGAFDEDWVPPSERTAASTAAREGLEVSEKTRWPRWTVRSEVAASEPLTENYAELISQLPPTGKTLRGAMVKELGQLDEAAAELRATLQQSGIDPETHPEYMKLKNAMGVRERLLAETGRPNDVTYSTHWGDTPNPAQHQRIIYNEPEVELAPPKPGEGPIRTGYDALQRGYTYTVQPIGAGEYRVDLFNPNNDLYDYEYVDAGRLAGVRRNDFLEERATDFLGRTAKRQDQGRFNQLPPETGKRGLYMQEAQADIEQQAKRTYRPAYFAEQGDEMMTKVRSELQQGEQPGLTEIVEPSWSEVNASAMRSNVQPFLGDNGGNEWMRRSAEYTPEGQDYDPFTNRTRPPQGPRNADQFGPMQASINRAINTPEFREYVMSLPQARRNDIYDAIESAQSKGTDWESMAYGNEASMELLREVQDAAGVPTAYRMEFPQYSERRRWAVPREPTRYDPGTLRNSLTSQMVANPDQPDFLTPVTPRWEGDTYPDWGETAWNYPENAGIHPYQGPMHIEDLAAELASNRPQSPLTALSPLSVPSGPQGLLELISKRKWPEIPLGDDRYALGMKRALMEAATTGQDFLAWPHADTQLIMNAGRSAGLFPNLYGSFAGTNPGYLAGHAKSLTGQRPGPIGLGYHDLPLQDFSMTENIRGGTVTQSTPKHPVPEFEPDIGGKFKGRPFVSRGVYLDEKTRKKIIEKGFPFFTLAPTAGVLGYFGSQEDDGQL